MLANHGQRWHSEIYAPSSWVCPLCIGEDKAEFPKAAELADHLGILHGGIFSDASAKAIVQQSRVSCPRPDDICPLCCRSMTEQTDPTADSKGKKKAIPDVSAKRSFEEEEGSVNKSLKRVKVGTDSSQPYLHEGGSMEIVPISPANISSKDASLEPEAAARHIAGHLRSIMLLTQRMIQTDVPMDVLADGNSVSSGRDGDGESIVMSKRDTHVGDDFEAMDLVVDGSDDGREEAWKMGVDDNAMATSVSTTNEEVDWGMTLIKDQAVDPVDDELINRMLKARAEAALLGDQKENSQSKPGMQSVDTHSYDFRVLASIVRWKHSKISDKMVTRIAGTIQVREDRLRLLQAEASMLQADPTLELPSHRRVLDIDYKVEHTRSSALVSEFTAQQDLFCPPRPQHTSSDEIVLCPYCDCFISYRVVRSPSRWR